MLYHLLFVTIQWVGGREQQVENISPDLFRGQSQSSPGVWRNGNTVVGLESTFCSSWCPGPHAAALFPRSFVKSRSCQILPYALNRITHQDCLPPRAAVDIEEINYTNVPFKQWSYANAGSYWNTYCFMQMFCPDEIIMNHWCLNVDHLLVIPK